jgi:hypothetical protein
MLNAYETALDASTTGFSGNFTQTYAWYVADRGYIRSADGWLWPNEPAGGTPGASYVLDASQFAKSNVVEVTSDDCTAGTNSLDCELIIPSTWAMGPVLVNAKLDSLGLPSALAGKPLTGTFSSFFSHGASAFTVFGEKDGKGSEGATARSPEGSNVTLANVGTDYSTVRMLVVPSGVTSASMMVEMSFAGETAANVWLLCEGESGAAETYGCIGWDGDDTFTDANDQCSLSGYMTRMNEYGTQAECNSACVSTAEVASWRSCQTAS